MASLPKDDKKEKGKEEKKDERLAILIFKKLGEKYGDESGKAPLDIIKLIEQFNPGSAEVLAREAVENALEAMQISDELNNLLAIKGAKTFMNWFSEKTFAAQIEAISKKGKDPKK